MRRWRYVVVAPVVLAALGAAPASLAAASPATETALSAVASPPPLPAGATTLGAVGTGSPLTVDVVLRPGDAGALGRITTGASSPNSPQFGQILRRGAFARQFGVGSGVVGALRAAASRDGLTVSSPVDGLVVEVTGTAGGVERLLHTRLTRVRLSDGTVGHRAVTPAELPSSLAADVSDVVGLDDVVQRHPASLVYSPHASSSSLGTAPGSTSRLASDTDAAGPQACPQAQSDAATPGVLTDSSVADLYGIDGLFDQGSDGSGQTIDIYELDSFNASDITAFDTCYFGAAAASSMASRLHVVSVDGGQPSGAGAGEATLDIENVSALAPGATIDVYEAPNTTAGSLDAFSRIVADDNAPVVATSAGLCEEAMASDEPGVQQIENVLFEQAADQGQTVVAATGDSGSSDCGPPDRATGAPNLSVDDPASQPYVLAVGGTSVTTGASPEESAWGDGVGSGGGGGLSHAWVAPGWQADSGVPGMADSAVIDAAQARGTRSLCSIHATTCRELPDVSAAADPTSGAVTVYYDGAWTSAGGTSSASPMWAAMLADTASTRACTSDARPAGGLGFAAPLLYRVAGNPTSYAESFTDVTSGTDAAYARADGLFPATTGYDMATGLGTPRLTGPDGTPGLAAALCSAAAAVVPVVSSLSPSTVPAVDSGRTGPVLTVHGSGFENSSGRSLVSSVTIGSLRIPAANSRRFHLVVLNAGTLTIRTPSGADVAPHASGGNGAGSYQVVVTSTDGASSTDGPHSLLDYVLTSASGSEPAVSAVGPTGGPRSGGGRVTIYGSDLDHATRVTFGSVAAPSFHIVSADELTAAVPAERPFTACANPTNRNRDVCQVEVTVYSSTGSSTVAPILRPYSGAYVAGGNGGVFDPVAPVGCGCEAVPAPTEYDYLATPRITSVSADTGADGRQYVSAYGQTRITVRGVGFGVLGYEWTDVGIAGRNASVDPDLLSITPTEITLTAPTPPSGSALPLSVPVTVQTLASPNRGAFNSTNAPSDAAHVVYASFPTVTRVTGGTSRTAGPTTGGTMLTLTGTGFAGTTSVEIVDQTPGAPSLALTKTFRLSGSRLQFAVPPASPGRDDVLVCTATACSPAKPATDTFTYFAPGDPTLAVKRRLVGPPSGGTSLRLRGTGLAWVIAVRFGSVDATTFSNPSGKNDGGNPTIITVVVPPGEAGSAVPVQVETLASAVDGSGFSPVAGAPVFTYRAVSSGRAHHREGSPSRT